ncbi:MAG TPA: adenylate/guanylate cyclase domain-containing protein [Terriglobia bacterium]|nr:adenylate/guanylate cyclase domain-containing protein [Terriglobia bacterium]
MWAWRAGSIPELRDQYTALGPNVNFAQRLEARAGKGQILVSASTHARVKADFLFEDVGLIDNIKNVPGAFRIFSLVLPK